MYYCCSTNGSSWSAWKTVAFTSDFSSAHVSYANSAGSVAWNNVTGKPESYTPSSHTHSYLPLIGGTISNGGLWTSIHFDRTDVGSGSVGGVDGSGLYFAHRDTEGHELSMYLKYGTGLKVGGSLVWTQSNDGSGSGLDADTLDSYEGSSYILQDGYYSNQIRGNRVLGVSPGTDLGNFYGTLLQYGNSASTASPGTNGAWYVQLLHNHNSRRLQWRYRVNDGVWADWKVLAHTDDTVAAANYADSAGNASKLNNQPASYYASASSLSNYLPLSGGTITGGNLIINKNDGCYIINNSSLTESIAFGNTSSSSGSSFGYVYSVNNSTGSGFNYLIFRDHKVGVNKVSPQYQLDVGGSINSTSIYENGTLLSEKYFPHSAGYYHPLTSYLRISNGEDSKIVLDNTDNETYNQFIEFKQNDTRYGVLGTFGDTNLKWGSNIILHVGNYSSYALPLSGGAMSNTNLVTNLNADKLDGYDANTIGTAGIIAVNRGGQFGYYHLYTKIGSLPTTSGTGSGESYVIFHIYNAIDFGHNDPSEWIVTASSRDTYNVQARKIIGRDQLTVGYVINDDRMEIWVCFDGWYMGQTSFKVESSGNFINSFSQTQTAPSGFVAGTKTYLLDGSTLTNSEIDTIIT